MKTTVQGKHCSKATEDTPNPFNNHRYSFKDSTHSQNLSFLSFGFDLSFQSLILIFLMLSFLFNDDRCSPSVLQSCLSGWSVHSGWVSRVWRVKQWPVVKGWRDLGGLIMLGHMTLPPTAPPGTPRTCTRSALILVILIKLTWVKVNWLAST